MQAESICVRRRRMPICPYQDNEAVYDAFAVLGYDNEAPFGDNEAVYVAFAVFGYGNEAPQSGQRGGL